MCYLLYMETKIKEEKKCYLYANKQGGKLIIMEDTIVTFECHRKHKVILHISEVPEIGETKIKANITEKDKEEIATNPWDIPLPKWCRICKKSIGEKEVESILISLDVYYEREKVFDTLKYRDFLRFDFYIPEYSLLIEFDGYSHFPSTRREGSPMEYAYCTYKLKEQLERDQLKNEWSKLNKKSLLRIPFWHIDKSKRLIIGMIKYIKENAANTLCDDLEDWRLNSLKAAKQRRKIEIPERKVI